MRYSETRCLIHCHAEEGGRGKVGTFGDQNATSAFFALLVLRVLRERGAFPLIDVGR